MRILVFSDVHANITALDAVLSDAGKIDAAWCLGDIVGYGPDPNECIEKVCGLPNLVCILGNHDAAAAGHIDLNNFNIEAQYAIQWTQTNISREELGFLERLPEIAVNGVVTLAHGSPRNPIWEYILDLEIAADNFSFFSTSLCFVGHTHWPLAIHYLDGSANLELKEVKSDDLVSINGRSILNPGSVGQPRDHNPFASYAIYDPENNTWEPHRISYDVDSVQERILKAGLPYCHALRLSEGW